MKIEIRAAKMEDIVAYTAIMQKTYESTYVDDSIGLAKECFSKDVFNSLGTQKYLKSKLMSDNNKKTWVAVSGNKIVGAITVENKNEFCELSGFYVSPTQQGKGIGKKLFAKVLYFAVDKDIELDIYIHNSKTINLYKSWGFMEDISRPHFYRKWPGGLSVESMYMRRITK